MAEQGTGDAACPSVSVIIPVYNEAATIRQIVERVRAVPGLDLELIVVDDASSDGTRELLRELAPRIDQLILLDENKGKGAALRAGFARATRDITLVQDADLEYDPQEYWKLIRPIADGHADVVYGNRFGGGDCHRVLYFWHMVANRFLTLCSNMLTNLNLSDIEVCYKAFRTPLLQQLRLREDRFGFEPEVTARLARVRGIRIYEVGVSYYGRTYEEGKKIGLRDAVRALYCIFRYNLFD